MSDETYDVLVVGSGAGGLAAAISARWNGLRVVIAEKEDRIGGTTARSGAALWIPCNPLLESRGISDDIESARTYIREAAGNQYDPDKVDAFLQHGPEMVEAFNRDSSVEFQLDSGPLSYSDYYQERNGSVLTGRSLRVAQMDGRLLGDFWVKIAPPLLEHTIFGMAVSRSEAKKFYTATRSLSSAALVLKRFAVYARDLVVHGRSTVLVNGNALIGGLLKTALDLKVDIWLSAAAKDLIVRDGRVVGAVVAKDGKLVNVLAERGVVLASGGFSRDLSRPEIARVATLTGQDYPSNSTDGVTGDGLRLAEAVGGRFLEGYSNDFYWTAVSKYQRPDGSVGYVPHSNASERCKPGVIAVNQHGYRFFNECSVQTARILVRAAEENPDFRCYVICDHRSLRRYGMGAVKPFPFPLERHIRSGYLKRGKTIEALAGAIGIDPGALSRTVREFNAQAEHGKDPEFGKGQNGFDQLQGDRTHRPNPCVGPLRRGPYYAMEIFPCRIGTFAGLNTNSVAQVLDRQERPIRGLYAVGNDMASIFGGDDPGAGSTLGPAMTFGFIAGRHLARQEDAGAGGS